MLNRAERLLIVEVLRWARANGWRHCGNWDAPFWSKRGVCRVSVDRYELHLHIRVDDMACRSGVMDYWPRSVIEALRVLMAIDVVPPSFLRD